MKPHFRLLCPLLTSGQTGISLCMDPLERDPYRAPVRFQQPLSAQILTLIKLLLNALDLLNLSAPPRIEKIK